MEFYSIVNTVLVNNNILSIKCNKETSLMEAAITYIFKNALKNMNKVLENWKEAVILSKIDDQSKKTLLGGL